MTADRSRLGRRGESLACLYLRLRGYRVLARNLRTPAAEIDLLLTRGAELVVCEVKSRRGESDFPPISLAQKRRLARAASWIFDRYGSDGQTIRIDLVTVSFRRRFPYVPRVRHLAGAFGDEVRT